MPRSLELQNHLIVKSLDILPDQSNLRNFNEIKDQILPFDIIAFRGSGIIGSLISVLEKYQVGVGSFTHVGMVVTADILPSCVLDGREFVLEKDKLYLFETTLVVGKVADTLTHQHNIGAQLRLLEEVIPNYITNKTSKVAWCKLINNPYEKKDSEFWFTNSYRRRALRNKFKQIFEEYHGRMYETDMLGLLGALFPSIRPLRDKRDDFYDAIFKVLHFFGQEKMKNSPGGWQFCSELIINIYQEIGIVPRAFDPKDVLPVDFFGYDNEWLPALVEEPVFIKDWDIPGAEAIKY